MSLCESNPSQICMFHLQNIAYKNKVNQVNISFQLMKMKP